MQVDQSKTPTLHLIILLGLLIAPILILVIILSLIFSSASSSNQQEGVQGTTSPITQAPSPSNNDIPLRPPITKIRLDPTKETHDLETAIARSTAQALLPGATAIPPETGIFETKTQALKNYKNFTGLNLWAGYERGVIVPPNTIKNPELSAKGKGVLIYVVAGKETANPDRGAVFVLISLESYNQAKVEQYFIPTKSGGLKITQADENNFIFTLNSDKGQTFLFDLKARIFLNLDGSVLGVITPSATQGTSLTPVPTAAK